MGETGKQISLTYPSYCILTGYPFMEHTSKLLYDLKPTSHYRNPHNTFEQHFQHVKPTTFVLCP
jgi:hypothetical protein